MIDVGFNQMIQQNATRPSFDSSPSSGGHAAATSPNSDTSSGSHVMVLSPALQAAYNTSKNFRDFFARLPVSSVSRNLQAGGETLHLPPYGPSTFIPASCVNGILHGMSAHLEKE
ncbi:hypothetical protein QL285_097163 [Trifolium repens]|jgi:hypothetical protein|nr:hypothetical protein QL285_097163 [Trifolium repens]